MQELSLSELNLQIKKTLEEQLAASYWVVAEIAQIQVNSSGHCYLELVQKEGHQVIAKARATIWAYSYRNISAWFSRITGNDLAVGMRILANTKVTFHEVYGLSLNIKDIDPSFTLGEREKAKQEVIAKLEADGIMDMNKELELPQVPQNIAIISSETAAGYGDFIDQIDKNKYGFKVHHRLFSASMQGEKAPESIIKALHQILDSEADLVVIIRGGGSQLDLDCFDNYELSSHIAQFPLPILTGIGHERDTSISDMVAHSQLKTPTAVAEFIIQGFNAYQTSINDLFSNISSIAIEHIYNEKENLNLISSKLSLLTQQELQTHKAKLENIMQNVKHASAFQLASNTNRLNSIEQKINLLNPKHLLQKGYSIIYKNGKPLGRTKVSINEQIEIITAYQRISSTVDKAIKNTDV
ncbi:MAG: exodeoxyribonuclease VII large subunit [Cyclobacteriaceae bacterium]|nr:exodeoxyribonuclease VII large subunit [Cyclobacteriaceae bacterium]